MSAPPLLICISHLATCIIFARASLSPSPRDYANWLVVCLKRGTSHQLSQLPAKRSLKFAVASTVTVAVLITKYWSWRGQDEGECHCSNVNSVSGEHRSHLFCHCRWFNLANVQTDSVRRLRFDLKVHKPLERERERESSLALLLKLLLPSPTFSTTWFTFPNTFPQLSSHHSNSHSLIIPFPFITSSEAESGKASPRLQFAMQTGCVCVFRWWWWLLLLSLLPLLLFKLVEA